MTSVDNSEGHKNGMSKSSSKSQSMESKSSGTPAIFLVWLWHWFALLPKTFTNLYADIKSGELLNKVPLLDAMCQFIVAVATSCHPQEEPMNDEDCKDNASYSPSKSKTGVFQGTPRTLRSRIVESQ